MSGESGIERKALSTLDSLKRQADKHSRIILLAFVATFAASWLGWINPEIPDWWPLVALVVAASGVTGFVAAIYLDSLIPDKDGIMLVSMRGDEPGGEIWELYEDTFEEMETDGTLYEWSESPRRTYEIRDYDPEENRAVGNWREAEPASAILDERTPEDAVEQIAELREIYEPEAARARKLLRRIRGIVRRLDRERNDARARQLDEITEIEDIDSKPISEILDEELPDSIHPEAGDGDLDGEDDRTNGHDRIDIELDDEPLKMNGETK